MKSNGLARLRLSWGQEPPCAGRMGRSLIVMSRVLVMTTIVGGLAVLSGHSAKAEDLASFYAGKAIVLTVATGPGGGYDAYARIFARYFRNHMPGNPTITFQYLAAAGGMVAVNRLYNVSKRDGTEIALVQSSSFLVGALGDHNAKFDNLKFTYIGNMNEEADTCSVWHTTGITNAQEFLTRGVVLGTAGPGANSLTFPLAMKEVLGANFKLVQGYAGASNVRILAMERGELQAACGILVSTLQSVLESQLANGSLRVVLQMGLSRHPRYKDIPNALEFARDDEGREALKLLFSQLVLGRPIVGPPEVPPERAAALSKAFADTMADPQFQEEARQLKLEMRGSGPDEMRKVMVDMDQASAETKARVRRLLGIN
jgi:tripartite-type tricarboxylate transporter receptor subunit TctC